MGIILSFKMPAGSVSLGICDSFASSLILNSYGTSNELYSIEWTCLHICICIFLYFMHFFW